jgi:hypothetical protein
MECARYGQMRTFESLLPASKTIRGLAPYLSLPEIYHGKSVVELKVSFQLPTSRKSDTALSTLEGSS